MFRILAILLVSFGCLSPAAAEVKVQKTEYKGWKNCYRVSNGEVELIVTADVGPRVIRTGSWVAESLQGICRTLGGAGEENFQLARGYPCLAYSLKRILPTHEPVANDPRPDVRGNDQFNLTVADPIAVFSILCILSSAL